jgi:hypothetical protein
MVFPAGLHGGGEYPVPGECDYGSPRQAVNVAVSYLIAQKRRRRAAVLRLYAAALKKAASHAG